jgi:hypothetical protein
MEVLSGAGSSLLYGNGCLWSKADHFSAGVSSEHTGLEARGVCGGRCFAGPAETVVHGIRMKKTIPTTHATGLKGRILFMQDTSSLLDLCDKVHDFAKQVEKGGRYGLLFLQSIYLSSYSFG